MCNGRTTTSAARHTAGDPCKVSSNLEKHTVAPVAEHESRKFLPQNSASCWVIAKNSGAVTSMPNTNPIIFEVQRGSPLPELLAECGMTSYRLARRRCPITEVLTEQGTIAHPPACRPRHGRNLRIQTAIRLRDRHRSSDDRCLTRARCRDWRLCHYRQRRAGRYPGRLPNAIPYMTASGAKQIFADLPKSAKCHYRLMRCNNGAATSLHFPWP